MYIRTEISDHTKIYVHDIEPQIRDIGAASGRQIYALGHKNVTIDSPCTLSIFLGQQQLAELYEQIKAFLEPKTEEKCEQSASV